MPASYDERGWIREFFAFQEPAIKVPRHYTQDSSEGIQFHDGHA